MTTRLTQDYLRKILHYDAVSGRFTWLRPTSWRVRKGDAAGCVNKRLGYVVIGIGGRNYYAHRLAWLYVYGHMPEEQIDHTDGNRTNNALCNLRAASMSQNQQNLSAKIKAGGRSCFLGTFASEQEAHEAYMRAKRGCHEFFSDMRVMRENREVS